MREIYSRALAALLFCMITISSYAQGTVSGTVSDNQGPLPGVSVRIKGGSKGTASNADGKFSIEASDGQTIVFSMIGYKTKEVVVGSQKNINVLLENDESQLSEVVVTGFGTRQNTKRLSYAITEVKGEELVRANNANVINALQGKVAGVMINQGASGPQSSSRIRIRGNSSLSQNTQPLLVIDNVLIEPGTTGGNVWGDAADFGNIMKNLNPDDYESITVLKGSAASALYGSKAQNGVLLITTKKGKTDNGIGVNFSHTESFDYAYQTPITYQNEFGGGIYPTFEQDENGVDIVPLIANINQGGYSFGPRFDGRMVRDLDGRMIEWKANNPLDFYQTGVFRNTNVALEGSNEKSSFRFSYSKLDNRSIMPNNGLDRNNFALRVTNNISKRVSLDLSVNYSMTDTKNPGRTGSRNNASYAFSYYMPRHVDLLYFQHNYINPEVGGRLSIVDADANDPYRLSSVMFNLYNDNQVLKENNLIANADLKVEITPWLNALGRINTNYFTSRFERQQLGDGVGFAGGTYQLRQENKSSYRMQGLLNASQQLTEDLYGTLSLGGETYRNVPGLYNNSSTDGGLRVPGLYAISNSVNVATTQAYPTAGKRTDAVYAFGDLTWRDQLTFNFALRNDWSSTLLDRNGVGKYTYFYPGVGLSWSFTELPYFKNNADWLSFGKLRASYAQTGLEMDPQMLNTVGFYRIQDGSFNNANNTSQQIFTFSDNVLRGSNLKNQLTKEFEFGLDMKFFDGRLGIDAAWYKKNTYNQIVRIPMPRESGVTEQLTNAGNIQNSGLELLLTANPVRSTNFNWNSTFNFTLNRNKVLELAPGISSYQLETAFGADVEAIAIPGSIYGTVRTGYAYASYQKKDASGNPIDHPSNGQKVIGAPSGTVNGTYTYLRTQDYEPGSTKELGNIMENFLLSSVQEFQYKNFNLSFQVDAKVGGVMASYTHQYGSANGSVINSMFGRNAELGGVSYTDAQGVRRDDGILPEGVFADGLTAVNSAGQVVDLGGMSYAEAYQQGLVDPIPAYAYYDNLTQWSTGIREESVFDNSWVALREVSVGYNLPKKWTENIKMKNLRVSVTGRNLGYIWKNAKDGVNPESIFSNRSGSFFESGALPYTRSIGFTINGSF